MRVDFGKVMERMRELRAKMSVNDSAKRFATMGVDVYQVMLTIDKRCVCIPLLHVWNPKHSAVLIPAGCCSCSAL